MAIVVDVFMDALDEFQDDPSIETAKRLRSCARGLVMRDRMSKADYKKVKIVTFSFMFGATVCVSHRQ